VFGIGMALTFLGERLTEARWLGAIMISVSVVILFSAKGGPGTSSDARNYSAAAADPPVERPKTP
jgi:drug/metabolite transporter (DMT)-like permease